MRTVPFNYQRQKASSHYTDLDLGNNEIMERHAPEMYEVILDITGDAHLSSKILKAALVHLSKKHDKTNTRFLLRPWMLAFAKYFCQRYLDKLNDTKSSKNFNRMVTKLIPLQYNKVENNMEYLHPYQMLEESKRTLVNYIVGRQGLEMTNPAA